ncbi:MAG TPA: twin-arginine translocation signal domain-containing protein [Mycobacterium sp.]
MTNPTRRAVLAAVGAGGGALALGLARRWPAPIFRLIDRNGMGVDGMDMSRYSEMFNRHNEITRSVEDIPGGIRTTTQSNAPDLVAQLQAHVSSMYSHLDQGAEVMCMSASLPTLFKHANGYRRQLTLTPTGVIVEETAGDPALTQAIRAHAQEVTGFVRDGMPAMMRGMMDPAMMGPR